jgi:hypothetical protein
VKSYAEKTLLQHHALPRSPHPVVGLDVFIIVRFVCGVGRTLACGAGPAPAAASAAHPEARQDDQQQEHKRDGTRDR